jgi:hypothetical protein
LKASPFLFARPVRGNCLMHEYSKEEVIAWLEKIQNDDEFDYAAPYDALAQAAIDYIKATMPALEGDTP